MRILKSIMAVAAFAFVFAGCNKKNEVPLSGTATFSASQEVPATVSTATGSATYSYTHYNRTLSYTFTWSGLTGNATLAHIHGKATRGFSAGVFQDFAAAIPKTAAGTYSGTLLIDGFAIKEEDLLAGLYYFNIHTAANPGGEIRAQIEF
jgi:Cu/Zn superoxide dismutase